MVSNELERFRAEVVTTLYMYMYIHVCSVPFASQKPPPLEIKKPKIKNK